MRPVWTLPTRHWPGLCCGHVGTRRAGGLHACAALPALSAHPRDVSCPWDGLNFLSLLFSSTHIKWGCNIWSLPGWAIFFSSVKWIHASVIIHVHKSVKTNSLRVTRSLGSVRFCLIYDHHSLEPRTGTSTPASVDRDDTSPPRGTGSRAFRVTHKVAAAHLRSQGPAASLPELGQQWGPAPLPEDDGQRGRESQVVAKGASVPRPNRTQVLWGQFPSLSPCEEGTRSSVFQEKLKRGRDKLGAWD